MSASRLKLGLSDACSLSVHPYCAPLLLSCVADESVLAPLLFRLTSKAELPILLIGGRPVQGSLEELRYLKKKGELQRMISAAGAEIYGAKKKQRKF